MQQRLAFTFSTLSTILLILSGIVVYIAGLSGIFQLPDPVLVWIFPVFLIIGLIIFIYYGIKNSINSQIPGFLTKENRVNLFPALHVLAGAWGTYVFFNYFGINVVAASSLVGLVYWTLNKNQSPAAFCGSFLGMSSTLVLEPIFFFIASILAGLIYVGVLGKLPGYGGKLGTIAFTAGIITVFCTGNQSFIELHLDTQLILPILIYSVVGASTTFYININLKLGPVFASSLVGIVAAVVLPGFYSEDTAVLFAIVIFCASFLGMGNTERIPNHKWMLLAGVFCGILFIGSYTSYAGIGGKLGTMALCSSIAVEGLIRILQKRLFHSIRLW